MEVMTARNLDYRYRPDSPPVLCDINLQLQRGELAVVSGLSGCGKSTLCLCLCGAIRHQRDGIMSGEVELNGKNIRDIRGAELALEVGIVFQDPDTQLFSPTVEDEIAFAPENLCLPPDRIQERLDYVLEILGITSLRYANPAHLSGGEKQLVALAAVLALDPPLLILDEVMSQLDAAAKKAVADAIYKLHSQGKTVLVVEHDLEVLTGADRLLIMESGHLIRGDKPEVILADRDFLLVHQLLDN
ncbi:MAG: ABC transporter ATP-binding protein [Syntrophomonadaceae bacterium]|nr:ABC transporter ATP-binding protein [Syntrophomonadaceae bacterium]